MWGKLKSLKGTPPDGRCFVVDVTDGNVLKRVSMATGARWRRRKGAFLRRRSHLSRIQP